MSHSKKSSHGHTRRKFNQTLAALAATTFRLPLPTAEAQDSVPARPDPRAASAEALTEIMRLRYGQYLSEEQIKEVRRSLERSLDGATRLKQFKLKNGDEPAFIFRTELP